LKLLQLSPDGCALLLEWRHNTLFKSRLAFFVSCIFIMNRPGAPTGNNSGPSQGTTSRIPLALQAVFLNGNRGIVVNTPPPEKAASKVFRGWWRGRPPDRTVSAISSGTEKTHSLTEASDGGGKPVEQIITPRLKKKKVR
jgi:hypothetical protein